MCFTLGKIQHMAEFFSQALMFHINHSIWMVSSLPKFHACVLANRIAPRTIVLTGRWSGHVRCRTIQALLNPKSFQRNYQVAGTESNPYSGTNMLWANVGFDLFPFYLLVYFLYLPLSLSLSIYLSIYLIPSASVYHYVYMYPLLFPSIFWSIYRSI